MGTVVERAYFAICHAAGRILRSARYSQVRVIAVDGERRIRKRRGVHAPALVALGGLLVRVLDTGVRVLPAAEWRDRECRLGSLLHRDPVLVDADGALIQPRLPGVDLAQLLEDARLDESDRRRAIRSAVLALVRLHELGVTHGDAMAENVLVDAEAATAHWIDFETVHDPARPESWRRADDVRALLSTCLVRTPPVVRAATLRLILDTYADDDVTRVLATTFSSVLRRPLAFHLGQAPLPFHVHHEIARLLRERITARGAGYVSES